MIFKEGDIKKLIDKGVSEDITLMRKESKSLKLHYFGTGTQKQLSKINSYENERQYNLRQNHAIENRSIVNNLLRPSDNMWTAKGGSKIYKFKNKKPELEKEFISDILSDVRDGMSMDLFMKEIWFQRFITDPNGIIFCEVSEDGTEFKLVYKDINTILAYKTDGIDIDWIIFEPHITINIDEKKIEKRYHWAVDESFYYLVESTSQGLRIIGEPKINSFGFVPGVVNSPIFNTEKVIKESPIQSQIDDLNSYLSKNSRKEIYQFLHDYPIYWQYETTCPTCRGMKKVDGNPCPQCAGTGRSFSKDVSDVVALKKPDAEEPNIAPPAGYVAPELDTMAEQRTELDWQFKKMFLSIWGTNEKKDNETATGRLIDIQPVINVLNSFASIAETIEEKLTDIIGLWFNPENWDSAEIKKGRRFIIEPPDVIWKKYLDAKEKFTNNTTLNLFLEQFYIAEFANDELTMEYYIKLMAVEPYVHNSIDEVNLMAIDDKVKLAKTNFPEWRKTKTVFEIIEKTKEQLRQDLYNFKF